MGQKRALAAPLELAQQHEQHENVVFLVSGHDGNKEIGGCAQQIDFGPKTALLGPKRATLGNRCRKTARRAAKNGLLQPPWSLLSNMSNTKMLSFLVFSHQTPMKPPFFRLRRTGLIWIISPPYPEVTLDIFGFPVDGRLAARRAVSWPRLPKVALFGPKSGFFGQKSIFCPHPPISSLPS